jgi:hypothetical protein
LSIKEFTKRHLLMEKIVSSPVIFLDFDDVICLPADAKPGAYDLMLALHELRTGIKGVDSLKGIWTDLFDEAAVACLKHIHEEFDPNYVLSTSWTRFLDRESMHLIMMQTGLNFVAEALHSDWETDKAAESTRAQQIANWLDDHPEVTEWLVLDDEFSGTGFNAQSSNVVLCTAGTGFTNQAFKQAWTMLRGP